MTGQDPWRFLKYVHSKVRRVVIFDSILGIVIGYSYYSPFWGAVVGAFLAFIHYPLIQWAIRRIRVLVGAKQTL